jgi:hypothetical protein
MGYTTEFDGRVGISPPLNAHEIAYLRKFAASRRMDRARGPYFVDGSGPFGQDHDDDIRDFNKPPAGTGGPAAGAGAAAEFERVYRANVDAVSAYFARRTADPQLVADLTADTFVAVISRPPEKRDQRIVPGRENSC